MIDFLSINFTLRLLGLSTDGRAAEMPLIIQYFHFEQQTWVNLYEITTIKAGINFRRMASEVDTTNEIETYFFNTIRAGYTPHMRILPGAGAIVPDLGKDLVISSNYSFGLNEVLEAYEFNFGNLYLETETRITEIAATFEEFIPMTTFFPVAEPESIPVPINELYTNIVSEIVTASDAGIDSPYKLSNISLKLKALIHDDGSGSLSATLLDLENSETVNEGAISELVFDITPVDNRENTSAVMPNCIGLTETAVRRILKNAGLRLNPVYQKKDTVVNGDSFKQSPIQGTGVQPNQLVTVIFSKHE